MLRYTLLLIFVIALAPLSYAHIDDEARQAYAMMKIEDDAVELVITLPARYAFPVVLDGSSAIELDKLEPEEMAERIGPVLAERNTVLIDGVAVRPTIIGPQTQMVNSRLPPRSFIEPQVMQYGELIYLARYETKSPPRRVAVTWDLFVPEYDDEGEPVEGDTSPVPVSVALGEKRQLVVFTKEEPGFTWHSEASAAVPADLLVARQVEQNEMRVPLLSFGVFLAGGVLSFVFFRKSHGAGVAAALCGLVLGLVVLPFGTLSLPHTSSYATPSDDEAVELFRSLHANIYRAFDYTDEGAIYDALAQSIDGPMLETIYNDVYQSLIMHEEGGAVCKIQKVEVQSATLDTEDADKAIEEGAYRVRAAWTVDGLVQHFGHTHSRTNAFEALYTIAPRGGSWRIVDAQILDQLRIDDGKQGITGGGS